jgi:hypothetical protein
MAFSQPLVAAGSGAGRIDFGEFIAPSDGGEFVEVNLQSNLLSLASKLVAKHEPEAASLLANIEAVRVNVVGFDQKNRESLVAKAREVKEKLAREKWDKIVTAQQKNEDVNIYVKTSGEAIEGVTIVVLEGEKQAVFVNVVGNIKPEQLSMLGDRLHIDELKKAGQAVEK